MPGYRKRSAFFLVLWLFVAIATLAFRAHESVSNERAPAAAESASVQATLRSSVADAKEKQLGALEPWQKSLFDNEVVPQYQRFIRDYRPTVAGLMVDVDHEAIRKYLMFHTKRSLNRADSPILVVARAEKGCAKCVAGEEGVRKLVKERLERRGFSVQFVELEQLGAPGAANQVIEAKAAEMARERDTAGVMTVLFGPAPIDTIDAAHADEKRFRIRTKLMVWKRKEGLKASAEPVTTAPTHEAKSEFAVEEQLDVLEADPLEPAVTRLLSDSMTGLASKIAADTGVNAPEFEVEVVGIKDYKQFVALKAQLEAALASAGPVEERMVSRGHAVFAVRTEQGADDLKAMLSRGSFAPGRLVVTESAGHNIKAELK